MAEYVTLKKNDGTIIYPQIGDGTVTSSKIDWGNLFVDRTSALTMASGWTFQSDNGVYLYKVGNMVFFGCGWGMYTSAVSANTWYNFATLPADCAPITQTQGVGVQAENSNGMTKGVWRIQIDQTTGLVKMKSQVAQSVSSGVSSTTSFALAWAVN